MVKLIKRSTWWPWQLCVEQNSLTGLVPTYTLQAMTSKARFSRPIIGCVLYHAIAGKVLQESSSTLLAPLGAQLGGCSGRHAWNVEWWLHGIHEGDCVQLMIASAARQRARAPFKSVLMIRGCLLGGLCSSLGVSASSRRPEVWYILDSTGFGAWPQLTKSWAGSEVNFA